MQVLKKMVIIVLTAFSDALAVTLFLTPLHFNSGGATGIVMLVQHFATLRMGIGLIILNGLLFFGGLRIMSRSYLYMAIMGALIQAGIFLIIEPWYIPNIQHFSIGAAVVGGLFEGWAVATSFKHTVSFGGMDLLTKIVQRITRANIGTVNLIMKGLILLGSFLLSPSWFELSGSIVFLLVTMFVTNSLVLGRSYLTVWNQNLHLHFVDPIHWWTHHSHPENPRIR